MAIHYLSLLIMFFLTLLSMITGNNIIMVSIIESYTYEQNLNGTVSDLDLGQINTALYLDPFLQAIIWISIVGGIAIASSFSVLGSGLGSSGSHWLALTIFYVALWIILSTLSFPLIIAIETIGTLIYLTLTIIYAIGVITSISKR